MKQFAFIDEKNVVTAIIVSESMETLSQIPGGNAGIELPDDHTVSAGDLWDGTQFVKQQIIDVEEVTPTPALEG